MDNLARKITIIPGRPELVASQTAARRLKVAAYCRVSTDDEEQLTSYENQIAAYTHKINDNPDWQLMGIFADEGLTGTSTKKRDAFKKMIALCKKGKVDLILTKSISRFARNTLDTLEHVRQLKLMGVGVLFEKENINTLDMSNEMVFTILAAFAQAESESISENVRWGKRHAMQQGHVPFQYKRILGYDRGEDGKPVVIPRQAAIVSYVYSRFLAGASIAAIKADLERQGIPSPSGKAEWSQSVIRYMLSNERYIGDALLQKSYVVDCISKQVRKNHGEVAQVYIENNHPAIISRDIFHRVQEELARRGSRRRVSDKSLTEKGKYSSKFALSELLICGDCGTRYRRVTWARNGKKRIVWRCINRLENGTQHCKQSPSVDETLLHQTILWAVNHMLEIREQVIEGLEDVAHALTGGDGPRFDRLAAQRKLTELETLAGDIISLSKDRGSALDYFEGKLTELYDERAALLSLLEADDKRRASAGANSARLESLIASIREAPQRMDAYDDAFARAYIEEVRVVDAETLIIVFKGGIDVEAKLVVE